MSGFLTQDPGTTVPSDRSHPLSPSSAVAFPHGLQQLMVRSSPFLGITCEGLTLFLSEPGNSCLFLITASGRPGVGPSCVVCVPAGQC